jgi:hypothetical protein
MDETTTIDFDDLGTTDLRVGAICASGHGGQLAGEPIHKALEVGNFGGFRVCKSWSVPGCLAVTLHSNRKKDHWPDRFLDQGRRFLYYGDNKTSTDDLHDLRGNGLLRDMFDALHGDRRDLIPPIFVFTSTGRSRDVRFEGMAVPGGTNLTEHDDLVAFWTSSPDGRFLNYRATFTMLPEKTTSASFLASIRASKPDHDVAPPSWVRWREVGWSALDAQPPIPRPWIKA